MKELEENKTRLSPIMQMFGISEFTFFMLAHALGFFLMYVGYSVVS